MEIKVYGPGCARCVRTEKILRAAVAESGADAAVIKVTDMRRIAEAGIMSTPAVAVDGVIKSAGAVPSVEEAVSWLKGGGRS